jgi:hypothetical protein
MPGNFLQVTLKYTSKTSNLPKEFAPLWEAPAVFRNIRLA